MIQFTHHPMFIYVLKNFSHMCKFKCKTFYFAERITFTRETTKSQRKTLNEEKTFVLPFYASTLSLSLPFCFRFTIIFPHFPSLAHNYFKSFHEKWFFNLFETVIQAMRICGKILIASLSQLDISSCMLQNSWKEGRRS